LLYAKLENGQLHHRLLCCIEPRSLLKPEADCQR
jgi:hypothetical protein